MSNPFHVIVQKADGTFTRSDKESETSAVKSAKAYVTLRNEKAAVVINNGHVVFEIPEGTKTDMPFMHKAHAMAKDRIEAPAPASKKKVSPPSSLKTLAAEYDQEMKKGTITIPETKPKIKACDIEILDSACITFSLARCVPLEQAQKICEANHNEIMTLAGQVSQNKISKYEAIQQIISIMQGNCPMTTTNSKETPPAAPSIDVSKVLRKHKGATFKPTRVREDIGTSDSNLEEAEEPITLPDGIVIYTTKKSDDGVHEILAYALGYTPSSLINMHHPAGIEGYDYRRSIPLNRPTIKRPKWVGMGGRIDAPGTMVKRIQERFPESAKQVKVEVAQGIQLE